MSKVRFALALVFALIVRLGKVAVLRETAGR